MIFEIFSILAFLGIACVIYDFERRLRKLEMKTVPSKVRNR